MELNVDQKEALQTACQYVTDVFFMQERIVSFDAVYLAYKSVIHRLQLNEPMFRSIYDDVAELCKNRKNWR
jgi:hypothetical protein